ARLAAEKRGQECGSARSAIGRKRVTSPRRRLGGWGPHGSARPWGRRRHEPGPQGGSRAPRLTAEELSARSGRGAAGLQPAEQVFFLPRELLVRQHAFLV